MTDDFYTPKLISDECALDPAAEGLGLLAEIFPRDSQRLISLSKSGSHIINPYHNLYHELGCVYWAHACLVNSAQTAITDDLITVSIAALFHDHNHSGGRHSDQVNVIRALRFVNRRLRSIFSPVRVESVGAIIRCTEFTDGKFPCEPKTLAQQCMRDADLMSIYSPEGRQLLIGLAHELNVDLVVEERKFLDGNTRFLNSATMYTEYGEYMKSTFLKDSLDRLEADVYEYRDEVLRSQ